MAGLPTAVPFFSINPKALHKIDEVAIRLGNTARKFGGAFRTVHALFGAFMSYSGYLELGYTLRSGRRMPARPHIRPAITVYREHIAISLQRGGTKIFERSYKRSGGATVSEVRRLWLQILNDKPRRYATQRPRCPVKYGYHRRSIKGIVE